MTARVTRYIFPLFLPLLLWGCSTIPGRATVRPHLNGQPKDFAIAELPTMTQQFPNLNHLRVAAIMSAAVYVDAPLTTHLMDLKTSGTPEQRAQLALLPDDWTEDTNVPRPTQMPGHRTTPDLTYRLWMSPEGKAPRIALLVFRGTHIKADWYSNLRWVDSWIPRVDDHYEQTERVTPEIVNYVRQKKNGTDILIFAAGHSLGGGLAQTAAYAACGEIQTVFAFDSSPVTKHRARNQCATERSPNNFYRVFEQSEILSYARFIVRLALGLKKDHPSIVEVKVHLFNGFGVTAHSMQQLSQGLAGELKESAVQQATR